MHWFGGEKMARAGACLLADMEFKRILKNEPARLLEKTGCGFSRLKELAVRLEVAVDQVFKQLLAATLESINFTLG